MTNLKLTTILSDAILAWHDRSHYEYQSKITKAIVEAMEESQKGTTTFEIPIELPRQSGKTTGVVDAVEFLLAGARKYFGRPLAIGIFAPQIEQATTDFERLKDQLSGISKLGFKTTAEAEGDLKIPQKWNSKAITLFNSKNEKLGEVYIFPITSTSNPESKTLDLIIIEEAQDILDDKMKNSVFPMGASTNAPRIYIGTAGTRLCYFKSQLDTNPRKIIIPLEQVLADRRARFEASGDTRHLLYERYVEYEKQQHGVESDYVQRQYFLKWKIGAGQFVTAEIMDALIGEHTYISESKDRNRPCYAGIDTAKSPDSTVVTVVRDNPELAAWRKGAKEKVRALLKEQFPEMQFGEGEIEGAVPGQICAWLELHGENYEDQYEIIIDFLKPFEIHAIAIDSTGQGDFMPDKFERHAPYHIIRVKFGAESKDALYKNLQQVIHSALTALPKEIQDKFWQKFRKQMIELEKEYKGRFMSVHHPERDADGKPGHDDYPDSWALAEWAKTETLKKQPGLSFL